MIVCTAGHRPKYLGGYTPEVARKLMTVAYIALDQLQPEMVICGMAPGWDMALGLAAVNRGLPITCAVPFHNHARAYSTSARVAAQKIYEAASDCVYVIMRNLTDRDEINAAFQLRNEWMVDHADRVAALWNGRPSGTANCIEYAKSKDVPVTNFWEHWS